MPTPTRGSSPDLTRASEPTTSDVEARLARAARELGEARAALERGDAERVRLLRELSGLQANFELKLQAERDKIERAQRDAMQALEHRILEFERRVLVMRELEARVDELEGQGLEAASLSLRNAELEARLAELEAAEAPHRTASEGARPRRAAPNAGRRKAAGGSPASAQDLRRIPGVGPAFARALVAQGITTFEQVAAWTDADIERIAPLIKVKPARIRKEDWVAAARALCASPEKG